MARDGRMDGPWAPAGATYAPCCASLTAARRSWDRLIGRWGQMAHGLTHPGRKGGQNRHAAGLSWHRPTPAAHATTPKAPTMDQKRRFLRPRAAPRAAGRPSWAHGRPKTARDQTFVAPMHAGKGLRGTNRGRKCCAKGTRPAVRAVHGWREGVRLMAELRFVGWMDRRRGERLSAWTEERAGRRHPSPLPGRKHMML